VTQRRQRSSRTLLIRTTGRILICIAVAVGIAFPGCTDLPTGPADMGAGEVKGITLVDWTANGYASASPAINGIAAAGANTIAIIVTAYQSHPRASKIRVDPALTPTPDAVGQAITFARALASPPDIVLKPHIDLDNGEWRGGIAPEDPEAWFRSYRAFLLAWAHLCDSLGVAQFVVGTELAGTLEHEGLWKDTIAQVRSVYSGDIVYAASWDEAQKVPFWSDMDFIGVNFYAPVSGRNETDRFSILARWQPWLARLRVLHGKADKPVILTEIGYRSVDGAGMHPYRFDNEGVLDLEEQADLYWAAMQAVGGESWIKGLWWWNWPANGSGGPTNKDYTPSGKPAEKELIDAW